MKKPNYDTLRIRLEELQDFTSDQLENGNLNVCDESVKEMQTKIVGLRFDTERLFLGSFEEKGEALLKEVKAFEEKFEKLVFKSKKNRLNSKSFTREEAATKTQEIGFKIKRLRKYFKISQAGLSDKSKISQSNLSRIERGCTALKVQDLMLICHALDLDICQLISK